MSKGSRGKNENLRGPKQVLKLSGSDTVRVWWVPILTRGKLHVELLPDKFPGETGEGAQIMVSRVRAAVNIRFQGATPPQVLFTDRGCGFYQNTGQIQEKYCEALREHGLKAFFGQDAAVQPGQMPDVMLHETAVAWLRLRLTKTLPRRSWEESLDDYRARLKGCAAYVNANYDVAGLCNELPQRVRKLDELVGNRLAK